jgi:signal transduction histidine kinase
MEWLAEHMQQQYGLEVEVEDDGHSKPLDNEARVLLFRAVRELLFNVLKHAQVSCARVCLRRDGKQLQVIVEDNGVGFSPEKFGASSGKMEGFGLFSIRERLNYFGGRMDIESKPGEVTRVILTMPLTVNKKKVISHTKPHITLKLPFSPNVSKAPGRPPAKTRSPNVRNKSVPTGKEMPA